MLISILLLTFLNLQAELLSEEDAYLATSLMDVALTASNSDFIYGPEVGDIDGDCEQNCGVGSIPLGSSQRFESRFVLRTTVGPEVAKASTTQMGDPSYQLDRIIDKAACMGQAERDAYYGQVCQQIDAEAEDAKSAIDQKIAVGQRLGKRLNQIYDRKVANENQKVLVGSEDQYKALCDNLNLRSGDEWQVSGVCRHAAITISDFLKACGFSEKQIRIPGYTRRTGNGHNVITVSTPYGVYTINWDEAVLAQGGDGQTIFGPGSETQAGIAIAWFDDEGHFLGNTATPAGIILDHVVNDGIYTNGQTPDITSAAMSVHDKQTGLSYEFKIFHGEQDLTKLTGAASILTYKPEMGFYGQVAGVSGQGKIGDDTQNFLVGDLILGWKHHSKSDKGQVGVGGEVHTMVQAHETGNMQEMAISNPASNAKYWYDILWHAKEDEAGGDHSVGINLGMETQYGIRKNVESAKSGGEPGFSVGGAPPTLQVGAQYLYNSPNGTYLIADFDYEVDIAMDEKVTEGSLEFGKDETQARIGFDHKSYGYTDIAFSTVEFGSRVEMKEDTIYFDMQVEAPLHEEAEPGATISLIIKGYGK